MNAIRFLEALTLVNIGNVCWSFRESLQDVWTPLVLSFRRFDVAAFEQTANVISLVTKYSIDHECKTRHESTREARAYRPLSHGLYSWQ